MADKQFPPHGQAGGTPVEAELDVENLGVAGRITRAFINSPLSPLLFMAMLFMGLIGLAITPRQEDPQISVPMVDIFVQYPGASAQQVASLAIEPLERIMSEIPGVEHVYSASQRGQGIVTVQFFVGEPLNPSIVKVHDRIQRNLDKIPPGLPPPLVKPKSIDDVPVVNLTLWSPDAALDDSALRKLALDILQQLKEIQDTGESFIQGGRADQVRVEVYPERLSGFAISLDQVANTIRTANAEQRAGNLESSNTHFSVYTGAFLRTAQDISRLVVGSRNDVPVYVRDVARISQEPADTSQIVEYYTGPAADRTEQADGAPAVTIALAKKEGSNGVEVANAILAKVHDLKGILIPDNIRVEITRNYGKTANDKVNELIFKLFVATGGVFILVLVAFRALRPAVVVLLVIPVVILFSVFSAYLMHYTIDRVSLFALIFAIGILVDDAIVVVENIYRRWLQADETSAEVAVDAVREVGNPTIIATFTVVAALLPMGFVRGMMGPYMEPIPALGSAAMIFSLLAAFMFTPWWTLRLKPSRSYLAKQGRREHALNARLEGLFRRILVPLIDHRSKRALFKLAMWGGLVATLFMFYTTWVRVKMLPLDNKPEFSLVINLPEGTALPVTANLTRLIAGALRDQVPHVTALQTYVGTSRPFDFNGMVRHYYLRNKPWQAEIQVQITDKHERDETSHDLAVLARLIVNDQRTPLGQRITQSRARIAVVEMPPGPPVLQTVVAEVHGPNTQSRRLFAADMTRFFEEAENISDVYTYMEAPYYYWRFEVDTEKAVRRGISVDTINRNVSMAMGGYQLGDIKVGRVLEPTHIVIQVPLAQRAQISRLGDLPIPTATGGNIPLAELGRFVRVPEDFTVFHKDLRAVEYVTGESVGRLAAPIYGMFQVEDMLKNYTTPDGHNLTDNPWGLAGSYVGAPPDDSRSGFEWAGEWTVTYETFRDLGLAFAAALVLIYILVVWEFGNFRVPALIMAPIPLTLLGIIPGHWLLNAEFTATSMIGWIALSGIIVRNSILLVDFSLQAMAAGMSVQESVIQACTTRTRPIVITAMALMVDSAVIVSDPIFKGMAISLGFGVMISTLLTLVVIPLGCVAASHSMVELSRRHHGGNGGGHVTPQPTPVAPPPHPSGATSRTTTTLSRAGGALTVAFYLFRGVFLLAWEGIKSLGRRLGAVTTGGRQTRQETYPKAVIQLPPPRNRASAPEPSEATPGKEKESVPAAGKRASPRPGGTLKSTPFKVKPAVARGALSPKKPTAPRAAPRPSRGATAPPEEQPPVAPPKSVPSAKGTAPPPPDPNRGARSPARPVSASTDSAAQKKTGSRKRRGIRLKSNVPGVDENRPLPTGEEDME